MTDGTPTPEADDLLRRSLRAEADGVEASDELLDRTLSAASRRAARPGRRLLVAAAVIAAIGVGAGLALTVDDSERQVDTREDPTTTSSSVPVDPAEGERPTLIALVREDGWLVVVDLETGEERELHFGGDPDAPPSGQEEGGPQFIDSVDLSPDGQWVYFSTCCEPASGMSYRIPVTGGDPQEVAIGAHPRVSPDGRFVATSHGSYVAVTPVGRLEGGSSLDANCCPNQLAWSPDGRQLAAVQPPGPDGQVHQVVLFDWDGTTMTPADTGKPDNPGSFVSWTPDGMLTISSGEPIDGERGLAQDTTYGWLLWVDEEGVVLAQAGHASSERSPIDGLPVALSADW